MLSISLGIRCGKLDKHKAYIINFSLAVPLLFNMIFVTVAKEAYPAPCLANNIEGNC